MPYIKQEDRERVSVIIGPKYEVANNPGELNFQISELVKQYFDRNGGRYQQINDILGALESAKQEFYARVARPYEDTKIQENGDVY